MNVFYRAMHVLGKVAEYFDRPQARRSSDDPQRHKDDDLSFWHWLWYSMTSGWRYHLSLLPAIGRWLVGGTLILLAIIAIIRLSDAESAGDVQSDYPGWQSQH